MELFCPRIGQYCIREKCIAYTSNTIFCLENIPLAFKPMLGNYKLASPLEFELNIGFCNYYGVPIDGGQLADKLVEVLEKK